jgi:hypothetical protein
MCTRVAKPSRQYPWLWGGLLLILCATQLGAQSRNNPPAQHPVLAAYDLAHELTVNGTVQKVVTAHVAGSPVGLHLLLAAPQGTVDAHLGPYLSKDVRDGLHAGQLVQIVGAMTTLKGKNVLLARQLIFGGRMVTVRSKHGFLLRGAIQSHASSKTKRASHVAVSGGAR